MSARRTLALISRQESIERLPSGAAILPLDPSVAVGEMNQVRPRPEDFLDEEDQSSIERAVGEVVGTWWRDPTHADSFTWRHVNLAECFSYGLWLTVRDMVKAAWILDRLMEEETPSELWTDVPPMDASAPAYPYMLAMGSILQALALELGLPHRNLASVLRLPQSPLRTFLARAYGSLTTTTAARLLGRGHPLVAVGPHREFYEPIAKAWRRTGLSCIVLCPARSIIRAAPRSGLFVLPLESLLSRKDKREVQAFQEAALHSVEVMEIQGPLKQGRSDLTPFLRTYLRGRIASELTDLAAIGAAFDGDLGQSHGLVLVETESSISKAMLRYAPQKGVPVTVLQHGVLGSAPVYRRLEGERLAAWGPTDAQWFRDNLDHQVQVEATGCPRYDALVEAAPSKRSPSLHLPTPSVLFASQPFVQDRALRSPWEPYAAYSMILESARKASNWTLILKWHPSQTPWKLPPGERLPETRILQFHKENTWALLRSSQVVLTLGSTVALEAMYLGRPVVFLGPPDPERPFNPPEAGGGLRATAREELSKFIEGLLTDDAFREQVIEGQRLFLAEHYSPLDGRASERVVAFLERG